MKKIACSAFDLKLDPDQDLALHAASFSRINYVQAINENNLEM